MDEEELVLCTHCKKEVAKANYDLHEPHCKRFLCICPDCDETVPRDQLEEHKTEQHAEVKCKMCNKKLERRHLLDHEKDECSERPQISSKNLVSEDDTADTDELTMLQCQNCLKYIPSGTLKKHKLLCKQSLKFADVEDDDSEDENPNAGNARAADFSFSSLQKKKRETEDRNIDLDKISTCPLCHLALPAKTLEWHETKCELYKHLSLA
ncbi:XIAP-associated factor 1-like isoform X2 [Carassius auratus]|uniref:XIAP-associated factor 1-like isoform X2 n=1 Tax=Carassius auratus TaxID=7957 RepID=A0A6P6LFV7_CARAU|nr:XIAP-associated factor 1-like isoform X2 [Carassius auratus]